MLCLVIVHVSRILFNCSLYTRELKHNPVTKGSRYIVLEYHHVMPDH